MGKTYIKDEGFIVVDERGHPPIYTEGQIALAIENILWERGLTNTEEEASYLADSILDELRNIYLDNTGSLFVKD